MQSYLYHHFAAIHHRITKSGQLLFVHLFSGMQCEILMLRIAEIHCVPIRAQSYSASIMKRLSSVLFNKTDFSAVLIVTQPLADLLIESE